MNNYGFAKENNKDDLPPPYGTPASSSKKHAFLSKRFSVIIGLLVCE